MMKRAHHCPKFIFVGQFPPPINGLMFIESRLEPSLAQAGYDAAPISAIGPVGIRSVLFQAERLVKTSSAFRVNRLQRIFWKGRRLVISRTKVLSQFQDK
jgi:hypothetical protein